MNKFLKYQLQLVFILIILLAIFLSKQFNFQQTAQPSSQQALSQSFDQELKSVLWQEINDWRVEQNKEPYFSNESICKFAFWRLENLDAYNFSHTGFWPQAEEFFPQAGFASLAENLASFDQDEQHDVDPKKLARLIFQSWLQSTKHKENLVEDFSHSCLLCRDKICIQVFGRY